MKCPECGMDNAEKNKFCGNCGGALGDASVADLFESAFKSEARGDLDAALEAYGRLLEKRPKSEEILFKTGMVCYELGRVDVAIEKFQQVIEQNPRFVYAHFRLGLCRYQKCMIEEAISSYSAAVEIASDFVPALLQLGLAQFHIGRLEKAAETFQKVVKFGRSQTIAHYYLGLVYERMRRADDAIVQFNLVADENPNDPRGEMDTPTMLRKVAELKERHGLKTMLWMGGEPLLRPDVLREGAKLFPKNTILVAMYGEGKTRGQIGRHH